MCERSFSVPPRFLGDVSPTGRTSVHKHVVGSWEECECVYSRSASHCADITAGSLVYTSSVQCVAGIQRNSKNQILKVEDIKVYGKVNPWIFVRSKTFTKNGLRFLTPAHKEQASPHIAPLPCLLLFQPFSCPKGAFTICSKKTDMIPPRIPSQSVDEESNSTNYKFKVKVLNFSWEELSWKNSGH